MPKKITVRCHGPIALNKKYKSVWEDVWLYWVDKPRWNKKWIAPCLVSKFDTGRELKFSLELQEENPDLDYKEEIQILKTALRVNEKDDTYIDNLDKNFPTAYSPKEYIDRKEAEQMIGYIMKSYGFENIICKWKRPKIIAIPM